MLVTYYNTQQSRRNSLRGDHSMVDILLGRIPTNAETYDFQKKELITKEVNKSKTVKKIFVENFSGICQLTANMVNFIDGNDFTEENKHNFYTKFTIPKRSGRGVRHLINPSTPLKSMQRTILDFMTNNLKILPHNVAHAFTKNRDAITNATVHKNSKYVVSLDIKDFFPSISEEILKEKLKNIHIFALDDLTTIENDVLTTFLDNLIKIATFEGCLPQGSPLSPYLSNLTMLEFDHKMDLKIANKELPYYWFTRYADDMTFSSKNYHNHHKLIDVIEQTLYECFGNKILLNKTKTKVLKNTGKCFITGAKLNKDNEITIGHEKKTYIKHELFNLFIAKQNGVISKEQTQSTLGLVSFMNRIEPEYTDYLSKKMLKKFGSEAYTLAQHFKDYL